MTPWAILAWVAAQREILGDPPPLGDERREAWFRRLARLRAIETSGRITLAGAVCLAFGGVAVALVVGSVWPPEALFLVFVLESIPAAVIVGAYAVDNPTSRIDAYDAEFGGPNE